MAERPPFVPESALTNPQFSEAFAPIVYSHGIPAPHERQYSEQSIETANHELNHALVALDYGILPISISVVPDQNSLGRTIFAGDIPDSIFIKIAAGGAVETVFGQARGYGNKNIYGSDFGYIAQIKKDAENLDLIYADAIEEAENSISRLVSNKEVLRRASEIIAGMNSVTGDKLGKIIEIAEKEVMLGVTNTGSVISEKIHTISVNQQTNTRTILETDFQGNITKRVIILNPSDQEKIRCMSCGEIGGHEVACSMKQYDRKKGKLSHTETIFVA